jgi:D-serine deaminase-like pyridoxal phosphate-dependent protein
MPLPALGAAIAAIDTPALVVDLDALERNIALLAAFAAARGLRLRPHAKTHKCAAIARLQLAAGAASICVQKTSEAEALLAAGIDRLYLSNEVIAPGKLARVAAVAARCTQFAIAVDSPLGVARLAEALRAAGSLDRAEVFVEIDVGQGRCGVATPEAAVELASQVLAAGLRLGGLQAYQGKAQHLRLPAERRAAIAIAIQRAAAARDALQAAGIACPLITGAGSGSFTHEAASGVYGELQCGSYVFMDRDYADNELDADAPRFEHALFVKSQVISRGPAHAVIDAGHKSHAIDSGLPRVWGADWVFGNGGDEHGLLSGADLPALGDTVWLIPGHCDPTVNLHDSLIAVRGGLLNGVVEAIWTVDARGCVS